MRRCFLQRRCAFVLLLMLTAGGCAGRSYDLSDYFVVKEKSSLFEWAHRDIYVRSPKGKLEYVGSTWHQTWPAQHAYLTGYNVSLGYSQDGRSIVYNHHPPFAGRRSEKDWGIYQYTYGAGERLLRAGKPVILHSWPEPMQTSSSKSMPTDIVVFYDDDIKWAATAEGKMFPLILYGSTPLHKAVFEDNESDLISLLDTGEYLNDQNYWGLTPLALALARRDEEVAIQLLEYGADPLAGDFKAIHLAAHYAQWRTLEAILESGTDPNVTGQDGKTLLNTAIQKRRSSWYPGRSDFGVDRPPKDQELPETIEGLRLLLAHGVDVNAKNTDGQTPLHQAITHFASTMPEGHELLTLLLAHGADPNAKDANGRTPLHYAVKDLLAVKNVQELIGAGANVNALDNASNTPLHFAGRPTMLLSRSNQIRIERPHGKSMWEQEYKPVVQLLISHSTDIDALNAEGLSPLHMAVRRMAINTAEFLVENGADDSVRYVPRDLRSIATSDAHREIEDESPRRSIRDQMNRILQSEWQNTDRD